MVCLQSKFRFCLELENSGWKHLNFSYFLAESPVGKAGFVKLVVMLRPNNQNLKVVMVQNMCPIEDPFSSDNHQRGSSLLET